MLAIDGTVTSKEYDTPSQGSEPFLLRRSSMVNLVLFTWPLWAVSKRSSCSAFISQNCLPPALTASSSSLAAPSPLARLLVAVSASSSPSCSAAASPSPSCFVDSPPKGGARRLGSGSSSGTAGAGLFLAGRPGFFAVDSVAALEGRPAFFFGGSAASSVLALFAGRPRFFGGSAASSLSSAPLAAALAGRPRFLPAGLDSATAS